MRQPCSSCKQSLSASLNPWDEMYLVVQQGGCPEVEWLISTASQPLPLEATKPLMTPRMGASPVAVLIDTSDLRDCAP